MMGLWRLLFPDKCPFCGKSVSNKEGICPACCAEYPAGVRQRLLKLPSGQAVECISVYEYDKVAEAIRRFKFGGWCSSAHGFALRMAETVPKEVRPRGWVLTFVPMGNAQERQRGYNQAELLAKELAKEWKLPCVRLLRKVKKTRTQHRLPAQERRENVKGAFRVCRKIRGKRVVLCDDIVTTGATLEECAEMLYAAGAEKIVAITVASA